MNKTIFVLGMLIVFVFAPFNVETAKADVNIGTRCVNFVPPINNPSQDDVCEKAGYYGCVAPSVFAFWAFAAPNCAGVAMGTLVAAPCDFNSVHLGVGSVLTGATLVCEDIRPWGVVPRPGSVPSDFILSHLRI